MKRILYFIKTEVRLLKKSIIIIALILTVFLSAFMGALSVRMDFVNGFYSYLDENFSSYVIVAYRLKTIDDLMKISPDELYLNNKTWLTCAVTLENAEGQSMGTTDISENAGLYSDLGAILVLNDKTKSKLDSASDALVSGQWNSGERQICVDKKVAEFLSLAVGDTVSIIPKEPSAPQLSYVVSGIFDREPLKEDYFFNFHYYITESNEFEFSNARMIYYDARSAHASFSKYEDTLGSLSVTGLKYPLSSPITDYFRNIMPIKLTLDVAVALFFAVMVVIVYTLMTMFYRQRKPFICRLKLLGAGSGTVFGIYFGIAVAIFLVVTLISSGFGVLFNIYFMHLCETVFELSFRTTFSAVVPLLSFAVLTAFTALMFALSGRRIRSDIIAQEVKAE